MHCPQEKYLTSLNQMDMCSDLGDAEFGVPERAKPDPDGC